MNSNSLFATVFKNFQWALRNLGYCPTMYMMLEATTALLSLPLFISVKPSRSLMTVTRNRFSTSSSAGALKRAVRKEGNEQLTHDTRDGPNSPTQSVEVIPRPLRTVHLLCELLGENDLGIENVQVGQEHQKLPHGFVQHDCVNLLHELAHDFALLVLHDQHLRGGICTSEARTFKNTYLLRLNHLFDRNQSKVAQNVLVNILPKGDST